MEITTVVAVVMSIQLKKVVLYVSRQQVQEAIAYFRFMNTRQATVQDFSFMKDVYIHVTMTLRQYHVMMSNRPKWLLFVDELTCQPTVPSIIMDDMNNEQ